MQKHFLLWAVLASTTGLWAQNPTPRPISIRGLSAETAVTGVFIKPSTATYQPFDLEVFSPGRYVEIGSGRTVDFFKQIPNPEDPRAPRWIRVASTQLLGASSTYTLLFLPLPQPDETGIEYRIITLNDESPGFEDGSLRLFNISPFSIAAQVGDTQVTLGPWELKEITPALNARQRVTLQIAAQRNGVWERFSKGSISLSQQRRATIIAAWSQTLMARLSTESRDDITPAMSVTSWHEPKRQRDAD